MDASHDASGSRHGFRDRMRIPIRVDMTPLVDVAFLLLTFFMVSTTMTRPQVMEMSLPPFGIVSSVAESVMLHLHLREDGRIFYTDRYHSRPHPLPLGKVHDVVVERVEESGNSLRIVLNVSGTAPYQYLIALLDEVNRAEEDLVERFGEHTMERARRVTITRMTPHEEKEVGTL